VVFTDWNMKVTKRQISMLLRNGLWCPQIFSAAHQELKFHRLYFLFTFIEIQPEINITTLVLLELSAFSSSTGKISFYTAACFDN